MKNIKTMDDIKLVKLANNFHQVNLGSVLLFFSYETLVAFSTEGKTFCIENNWGPTTGKHLNKIESDKKKRLNEHDFKLAQENFIGKGKFPLFYLVR